MVKTEQASGMDTRQVNRIAGAIEDDIDRGLYYGASIRIARHGHTLLDRAFGRTGDTGTGVLSKDAVFRVLSVTKSLTNVLVLQCIDRGMLSFSTRVIDVIPEFMGADRFRSVRKDRVTVAHLLTHTAGLPTTPEPVPYDRIGDLERVIRAICQMDVISEPGERLVYSPAVNHALLGEIVRRVHGASRFRDVLSRNLLEPLGMESTQLGNPAGRDVVPITANFADEAWQKPDDLEALNDAVTGDADIPWVGLTSTTADLFAFAEMLRNNGEHRGQRLLSAAVIDRATTNQTGDRPNDFFLRVAEKMNWEIGPGYLGLAFPLSGDSLAPSLFGALTSPRTFGAFGAGSTLWWVDPESQVTFVCLTSGIMAEDANILRFQRLSDMAAAAAV